MNGHVLYRFDASKYLVFELSEERARLKLLYSTIGDICNITVIKTLVDQ